MTHFHRLEKHEFKWIPASERPSRFPGESIKKNSTSLPEKNPNYWLAIKEEGSFERLVYFVNDSKEVIDSVKVKSNGFFTSDDDFVNMESNNNTSYKNIRPGEAILVDRFNLIYDSDFFISVSISIDCKSLNHLELTTEAHKGFIPEQVLVWDTLEIAKGISVSS